jgi:hypothetical protein
MDANLGRALESLSNEQLEDLKALVGIAARALEWVESFGLLPSGPRTERLRSLTEDIKTF